MKIAQPASDPSAMPEASFCAFCPKRSVALALLAALLCSGATSCTRTQIALSVAAIAAVAAGTTVAITYTVQNHHHTLQGCLFSGPGGLQLRTSDSTIYTLEGNESTIKVGDRVKLHGSKVKRPKGSTDNQVFVVEKLSKDYGSCPANFTSRTTQTQ